jgi:hypothetical protein
MPARVIILAKDQIKEHKLYQNQKEKPVSDGSACCSMAHGRISGTHLYRFPHRAVAEGE